MSLIPTVFRSTDPGAPILTGTAGSLAALMDAVLVDGYGTGADTKVALGWTRAFSSGHKRAYQNDTSQGGTGLFWRVEDSNARYALNSGFHTMSGIDTGIDEFGGGSNGWSKSISADTTPRAWLIVGNSRSVYVFIWNGYPTLLFTGHFVGDYACINKSYVFNFGLTNTKVAAPANQVMRTSLLSTSSAFGTFSAARSFNGGVVGADMTIRSGLITNQGDLGGSSAAPYPYPPSGAMLVSRVMLNSGGYLFAMLPGMWAPEHAGILTRWTEYTGLSGNPSGRWLAVEAATGNACQGLIQLDSEWEY